MRIVFFVIAFAFLSSCNETGKSTTRRLGDQQISATQIWINKFLDEYRAEFETGKNSIVQNEIKEKYEQRFRKFAIDTCNYLLDSILVNVDDIESMSENKFLLKYSNDNSEYRFVARFKEKPTVNDSLYKLIRSQEKYKETMVSFLFIDCKFNDANNPYMKPIDIEAIPASLSTKRKK